MGRLGLVVGGHWESLSGSLGVPLTVHRSAGRGGARPSSRPAGAEDGDVAVLARHGADTDGGGTAAYFLPHELDHVANMRALAAAGCDRVLAIGSVGGLHRELAPGTFVCPDDFIALDVPHRTALRGMAAHRVPGFDPAWRREVIDAFAGAEPEARIDVRDGGVYWQVAGPRLETVAEIRFVARHADVIGMTIAAECVAAGELGLRHAAVCVVDNFANGVADTALTLADVEAGRERNRGLLERALAAVLGKLA